jgi:hypothetical protein
MRQAVWVGKPPQGVKSGMHHARYYWRLLGGFHGLQFCSCCTERGASFCAGVLYCK